MNSQTPKIPPKRLRGGGFEFYNFALGGSTAIQNLYELKRERNQEIFKNAKLIITESNINEIHNHTSAKQALSLDLIYRDLSLFYNELSILNKPVLVLCLPECNEKFGVLIHRGISKLHKKFSAKFGFNFIDMREFYEKHDLISFGARIDSGHQLGTFMSELGENIIKNLENFKAPFKLKNEILADFKIINADEMQILSGNLECNLMQNSNYKESTFRLQNDAKLGFPPHLKDYELIAIHNWLNDTNKVLNFNTHWALGAHSSVILQNKNVKLSKEFAFLNQVIEVQKSFVIDEESVVYINCEGLNYSEFHVNVLTWRAGAKKVNYDDLIAFFLIKKRENFKLEKLNLQSLNDELITLSPELNFAHLIPRIYFYKKIIDEYCAKLDPKKLKALNNEINALKSKLDNDLDALRAQNLKADLELKNLQISKLKSEILPNDKQTELRIKNHLSYKLGQALIKAYKHMWRGDLIKFFFYDAFKISRDFKKRKK